MFWRIQHQFQESIIDSGMTTKKSPRKQKIGRNIIERGLLKNGRRYQQSYTLVRLLGRGGFASCYETKMGEKKVAIKIMSKLNKNEAKHAAYNEEKIKMEIDIISSLKHSGVVGYFHHFEDDANTYLIQELCAFGTLGDVVKNRKNITEPQVRYLIVQLVSILEYIKSKNIIHRDIKPANIFIGQNFQLKLGDFGLAVYNDENFRAKRGMCGTPNYIAPEVITKQNYSFEVDTWSTGVLIFTLLFGVAPFETKTCELTYEQIKKGVFKFQGLDKSIRVSEDAKDFIGRILVLDQRKRMKLQEFLNHPFMMRYTIPTYLQPTFCRSIPSISFNKKYSKPLKDKKQSISRTNSLMQTKQIQSTLKATKNTYKDILHNQRTSTRAGATNSPHSDSDNNVKEQSSERINSKVISKRIDNRCYDSPNKIREEEFDRIEYGNKKGRKKFRYDTAQQEQTHKKFENIIITPYKKIEKVQKKVENQDYFLKNRIKYTIKSKIKNILTIDLAFTKPITVKKYLNCIETFGLCYYLSNNQFGFVFNDASKMISTSEKIILYIYRKNSEVIKEILDLDEKRSNISSKLSLKIQAFNEYKQILVKGNNTTTSEYDLNRHAKSHQIYVKNFKVLRSMILCKLSDNSLQCLFQDGTSALISLESKFIFYQKGAEQLYYSLPLTDETKMDPFLREKLSQFCDFFRDAVTKRIVYTNPTKLWNLPTNLYSCKSTPQMLAI